MSYAFSKGTSYELSDFVKLLNNMTPDLKLLAKYDKLVFLFFLYVDWIMQWQHHHFLISKRNGQDFPTSQHCSFQSSAIWFTQESFYRKLLQSKNIFWMDAVLYSALMRHAKLHFLNLALIFYKAVSKKRKVTLFPAYTRKAYTLKNTTLKHCLISASDPALAQHFKDPPLFGWRRGPNFCNKLVQANRQVWNRLFEVL